MARYTIITVVDITRSKPSRTETDLLKLGQQANFNSLLQAIGLRSNITWDQDPKMYTGRLPEPLEGKANHWIWEFDTERDDTFLVDDDPIGLLKDDVDLVPIVGRLNNTTDIEPAVFRTNGKDSNIWIYKNEQ